MAWQELISIQAFLTAIAVIVTRLLARDKKTAAAGFAITAGWFAVLYIAGLIMLPLVGHVHSQSFSHYWPQFLLGGVFFALANVFIYHMFVYLDVAVGTIFGNLAALFTVIGAAWILDEDLSPLQIAGASCLLVAIIYTALATRHRPTRAVHKKLLLGLFFALVSGLFYAAANINEKWLLERVSPGDYMAFGWLFQALAAICFAVVIQTRQFAAVRRPAVLKWTVVLGILRAVSGLLFIKAMVRSNNVGLVTVITNFKIIVVVALGTLLLRERNKLAQKTAGAAIAIAGLVLMFW